MPLLLFARLLPNKTTNTLDKLISSFIQSVCASVRRSLVFAAQFRFAELKPSKKIHLAIMALLFYGVNDNIKQQFTWKQESFRDV